MLFSVLQLSGPMLQPALQLFCEIKLDLRRRKKQQRYLLGKPENTTQGGKCGKKSKKICCGFSKDFPAGSELSGFVAILDQTSFGQKAEVNVFWSSIWEKPASYSHLHPKPLRKETRINRRWSRWCQVKGGRPSWGQKPSWGPKSHSKALLLLTILFWGSTVLQSLLSV